MMNAAVILDLLPESFTTDQAVKAGLSKRVLTRLVRRQDVVRTARGVYRRRLEPGSDVAEWAAAASAHHRRCREFLLARPGHAVSHLSAALLHGLSVPLRDATPVEVTSIDLAAQSRRVAGVVIHHCDSLENETIDIGGLRVTTLARTLADIARQHPLTVSVPVLDAAIRSERCTGDEVQAVLVSQARWVGRPRGFQALAMVDPARESWLESYSFVVLWRSGLSMPTPQVEVFDHAGRFVARVDGMLLGSGVVLECDGAQKYALGPETTDLQTRVARHLMAQNARQLALESLGLSVVRWTTHDITRAPSDVLARIRRAQHETTIGSFTGRLRVRGEWWVPTGDSGGTD